MALPPEYPLNYEALAKIVALDPAQAQAITAAYTQVTGLSQLTTSSLVAVTGSQLQTSFNQICSYYLSAATNNIKAQIYGSVDGVNFVAIGSPTTINAAASALVSVGSGGYLYYKLYVEDATGGSHGTVTGAGFCI